MVDITHKSNSLRKAIASAIVSVSKQETIDAINDKLIPKGDIFEFSRVAGLFAVKKTSEMIPDCHPLPIEYTQISYEINNLEIHIRVEVHTIYKTGVEVEAMHGASVVALTIYDMLKPIDKDVEINNIRLVSKKGGKSDSNEKYTHLTAAIVVCSDSISKGLADDTSGLTAKTKLEKLGLKITSNETIPDDFNLIQDRAKTLSLSHDLILFIGGTGLGIYDLTPDALRPLIEKEISGITETARQYGQQRISTAMLSRGIAGFIGRALVITIPGSPNATKESIDALFPAVLHVFKIKEGQRH